MTNEAIFFIFIIFICSSSLVALKLGKSALIALICLQAVLANLFVTKQITLFGLCATTSDALAIGAALGLNILQEYWGKSVARTTIVLSFCAALFYTVVTQLHLWYTPHALDNAHEHFCTLLSPMPRIIAASLFTYILIQWLDSLIYTKLKTYYTGKHFTLRNMASLGFTQLLDTVLFSFLGLYGSVVLSIGALQDIIVISYILKMIIILTAVPVIACIRTFIKP